MQKQYETIAIKKKQTSQILHMPGRQDAPPSVHLFNLSYIYDTLIHSNLHLILYNWTVEG